MAALESCASDKDALVLKLMDALMFDADPELDNVVSTLAATLDQPRFDWLKQTYEQGEDIHQTVWDSARAQMLAEVA